MHRVPIFVECSRSGHDFNAEWLAAAVIKAKRSEAEGYLPPLHIRHHEAATEVNDSVRAAGFFRILGVELITFKGSSRQAVIADLVITDPQAQVEVLSMRLPYRSVEIFNADGEPSIDSLALLDHEAPFLELPMLLVAKVDQKSAPAVSGATLAYSATDTVAGSFMRGARADLLFRFEDDMATTTTETPAEVKTTTFASEGDKPPEKKGDGEKKGGDKMEGAAALDAGAVIKAIKSGAISVKDMDAIVTAIREYEAGSENPKDDSAPAPAAAPGAGEAMKADTTDTTKFAALQGELAATKARLDERDAHDKRRDDVAAAMKTLDGRPLGSDLEGKLIAFHKEHGPAAFKAYVESMAATFGKLSTDSRAAAAFSAHSNGKAAPTVAAKYLEHGADAVEKAANYARQWAQLNDHGLTGGRTEERFVAINMKRDGYELTKV